MLCAQKQLEISLNVKVGSYDISTILCYYVDGLQRYHVTKQLMAEAVVAEQLERAARIFPSVVDKDVFLDCARTLLARRLLGM